MAMKVSMRRLRIVALLEQEFEVLLSQLLDCQTDCHLMVEPLQLVLIRTYFRPKVLLTQTSLAQVAFTHLLLIQIVPSSW